jgi:hypothetical protein
LSYDSYRRAAETATPELPAAAGDNPLVAELVAVLARHPAGLRRWSVMRAVRQAREAKGRDIPLKLEADLERAFRQFCLDDTGTATRKLPAHLTIFRRPKDKAGEVWALNTPANDQRAGA